MAVTGTEVLKLEAEIAARLKEDERRAARRLLWLERLASLWAPLIAFVLAFIPYVTLIEFNRDAASWAQPVIKGLGLLALIWFGGLTLLRLVGGRLERLRKLRRSARELEEEVGEVLRRHGAKVEARIREEIVGQVVQVRTAAISGVESSLEKQLEKLAALVERHLDRWRRQSVLDLVLGFGKALLIALLIRTVVVEPFKIPSGSMIPTLEVGDQVFVNKFIYGVRIPWVNVVPFVIVRPPQRGDVIVFNNPVNESLDFIKRVVGVPGDRIEVRDEIIYVNGEPQPRRLISSDALVHDQSLEVGRWTSRVASLYEEKLGEVTHATLQAVNHPHAGVTEGPYVVPAGHVFVMGDNRDNSADSRYGLGGPGGRAEYVPYGHIKGKAMVIWLSLSYDGLFSRFFSDTGLRVDRLFLPVR